LVRLKKACPRVSRKKVLLKKVLPKAALSPCDSLGLLNSPLTIIITTRVLNQWLFPNEELWREILKP
jgi:hypothetical protein